MVAGDRDPAHRAPTISPPAPKLKVLQKFGSRAPQHRRCAAPTKGVKLLTLRRRASVSCAEHAFGLMLMLARKLDELDACGPSTIEHGRGRRREFQRQHTPGGSYAAPRRHKAIERCDHRHRLASARSAARLRSSARAFAMNAFFITSAHGRAGNPRSALSATARAARDAARRKRLHPAAAADAAVAPAISSSPAEFARIEARGFSSSTLSNAAVDQPRRTDRGAAQGPARRRGARRALQSGAGGRGRRTSRPSTTSSVTPRMAGSPRLNGLNDFEELITKLAREFALRDTHRAGAAQSSQPSAPGAGAVGPPAIPTVRCA